MSKSTKLTKTQYNVQEVLARYEGYRVTDIIGDKVWLENDSGHMIVIQTEEVD